MYSLQYNSYLFVTYSKTGVNSHSKIEKTKILMTNGSLMKVKSIAEHLCGKLGLLAEIQNALHGAFCNAFALH